MTDKPVWMEEWVRKTENVIARRDASSNDRFPVIGHFFGGNLGANPDQDARARLAAAAPAMARLLLELEWAGDEARYVCPSCTASGPSRLNQAGGHAVDCRLVAVLRLAGVRE